MHFDYSGWQNASPRGIRGGNNNYLMGALFYDQEWREDLSHYVLGEEAYQTPSGKWLPSAYQIVVYSNDEYGAMKKLVGSLVQWDKLKTLDWFSEWLERALREQEARIMSEVRVIMLAQALTGCNQSARTVLAIDKEQKKAGVGRPKGKRKPAQKEPTSDNSADASRVLGFKR